MKRITSWKNDTGEDVTFISPEEYDKQYGDDDDD